MSFIKYKHADDKTYEEWKQSKANEIRESTDWDYLNKPSKSDRVCPRCEAIEKRIVRVNKNQMSAHLSMHAEIDKILSK
jgi:hypothetical protein